MEVPWSERKPPSFALLYVAIGAAIATAGCFLLDPVFARLIAEYQPSTAWDAGLEILEWAILLPLHKLALPVLLVVAMLCTIFVKSWRGVAPALMTITAVHLVTRLTTNWIKDGTGRERPAEWIKKGVDGSFGYEGVSFPSGHVVLFAGLAIPILYVFPRARRVLAVPLIAIVVYVGSARIAVNAHWISDTLGSISWVVLWTWAVSWATRPHV